MKHKAKESFRWYLSGITYYRNGCYDDKLKPIRETLDNQLTVDELEYVIDLLIHELHDERSIQGHVFLKNIIKKLQKQKEMWCGTMYMKSGVLFIL